METFWYQLTLPGLPGKMAVKTVTERRPPFFYVR